MSVAAQLVSTGRTTDLAQCALLDAFQTSLKSLASKHIMSHNFKAYFYNERMLP